MSTSEITIDYTAIKERQQRTWSAGDYALIGTTLQLTGELLCEAVDVAAGERVLDVAAGNGNAALAAARRGCDVTACDYVPALLERARARAAAEGLNLETDAADAEALPYADASFDVVLSTFGVMFTPQQEQAASELLRVCRPGGRIGLISWTPTSFVGQMFKLVGRYTPPPAGLRSPLLWGSETRLGELFGQDVARCDHQRREFIFRYRSAEHWLDAFRAWYGPMNQAFAAIEPAAQVAFERDLLALAEAHNTSSASLRVPSEYLLTVAVKAS